MAFWKGKKEKPKNGNENQSNQKKKNNRNLRSSGSNGRSWFASKTEFKFQMHDDSNKKTYTFDKIREAIIMKLQTMFQSERFIVVERNSVKKHSKMKFSLIVN